MTSSTAPTCRRNRDPIAPTGERDLRLFHCRPSAPGGSITAASCCGCGWRNRQCDPARRHHPPPRPRTNPPLSLPRRILPGHPEERPQQLRRQRYYRGAYQVLIGVVRLSSVYFVFQDVDFASSFLCGYLRIRGLTDDWPELTTYFDAEVIGSRYGFLTRNWGASEQEDWVHWARFPAFRQVKHELEKPHLTMKDADRGAVFMRWKEKFLVPDHRVQDINGASFAGQFVIHLLCLFIPSATSFSSILRVIGVAVLQCINKLTTALSS